MQYKEQAIQIHNTMSHRLVDCNLNDVKENNRIFSLNLTLKLSQLQPHIK